MEHAVTSVTPDQVAAEIVVVEQFINGLVAVLPQNTVVAALKNYLAFAESLVGQPWAVNLLVYLINTFGGQSTPPTKEQLHEAIDKFVV